MSGRGDKAVAIRPEGEHPAGQVVAYCQKDKKWSEERLGDSACSMAGSGCLVSCIASALSSQWGIYKEGRSITAGELNRLFGQNGVYNEQGDIVWGKIKEALPQAEVLVTSSVKGEEIEELLEEGRYPAVKVKVGGYGAAHWVLIVGSEDGEYLCMDPLREDGELVSLEVHGGVVYRMRCVYWKDQGQ